MNWLHWSQDHFTIVTAVVGWLLALLSLGWNVHQASRQRRTKVKVIIACDKSLDTSLEHVRFLTVNVVNVGTDLNDMNVILSFPNKEDGKERRIPLSIYSRREVPNPFCFGYAYCWHVPNDDPSQPFPPFDGVPLKKIVFNVSSASRSVAVVPASKWKRAMNQFTKADSTLPRKPEPRRDEPGSVISGGGWLNSYKGKW